MTVEGRELRGPPTSDPRRRSYDERLSAAREVVKDLVDVGFDEDWDEVDATHILNNRPHEDVVRALTALTITLLQRVQTLEQEVAVLKSKELKL